MRLILLLNIVPTEKEKVVLDVQLEKNSDIVSRIVADFIWLVDRVRSIMQIEEYYDGVAFYTDDKKYEIAFYSNITNRVTYNDRNGYKDWKSIGCICIPYEDNLFIMDEVKKYKMKI